jgi:hypothetical protein
MRARPALEAWIHDRLLDAIDPEVVVALGVELDRYLAASSVLGPGRAPALKVELVRRALARLAETIVDLTTGQAPLG